MTYRILLAQLALLTVLNVARAQTIRYVDASKPGGDGLSWDTAYMKLNPALQEAEGGGIDQIWVADGTYHPAPANGLRTKTFQLISGVSVYGGFAGGETELGQRDPAVNICILSGDLNDNDGAEFANYDENSYHVVTGSGVDSTAVLDGFTIKGGNADGEYAAGAGVLIVSGSPAFANCTITLNRTGDGEGAYVDGGTGAGVYISYPSSVVFTNCTITMNMTGQGGEGDSGSGGSGGSGAGICCLWSSLTLDGCTISGNCTGKGGDFSSWGGSKFGDGPGAGGGGGGLYLLNSDVVMVLCAVMSNVTGAGGEILGSGASWGGAGGSSAGIHSDGGSLLLESCILAGNVAGNGSDSESGPGGNGGSGGALILFNSDFSMTGCVMADNHAGHGGSTTAAFYVGGNGGGYAGALVGAFQTAEIVDCEILNNIAGNGGEGYYAGDGGTVGGIAVTTDDILRRCTIADNHAGAGGSSQNVGGDGGDVGGVAGVETHIVDCEIFDNTAGDGGMGGCCAGAGGGGGGVHGYDLKSIVNCRIFANRAGDGGSGEGGGQGGYGGGIYKEGNNSLTIVNCAVFANDAGDAGGMTNSKGGWGGGIYGLTLAIANCTIWGNDTGDGNPDSMDGQGGGVNMSSGPISNSILWANTNDGIASEEAQVYDFGDHDLDYNCVQFWSGDLGGTGNFGDDPILVDPDGSDNLIGTADDNFHLSDASPCIDAADNNTVPADSTDLDDDGNMSEKTPLDLDLLPRFVDDPAVDDTGNGTPPIVDMGVYEFDVTLCSTCQGDSNGDGVVDGDDVAGFVECVLSGVNCACTDQDGDGVPADQDTIDDLEAFVDKLLSEPDLQCL